MIVPLLVSASFHGVRRIKSKQNRRNAQVISRDYRSACLSRLRDEHCRTLGVLLETLIMKAPIRRPIIAGSCVPGEKSYLVVPASNLVWRKSTLFNRIMELYTMNSIETRWRYKPPSSWGCLLHIQEERGCRRKYRKDTMLNRKERSSAYAGTPKIYPALRRVVFTQVCYRYDWGRSYARSRVSVI